MGQASCGQQQKRNYDEALPVAAPIPPVVDVGQSDCRNDGHHLLEIHDAREGLVAQSAHHVVKTVRAVFRRGRADNLTGNNVCCHGRKHLFDICVTAHKEAFLYGEVIEFLQDCLRLFLKWFIPQKVPWVPMARRHAFN